MSSFTPSLRIKKLDLLFNEFQRIECPLDVRFDRGNNFVPVYEIMGLNLIQHLRRLQLVLCLQGWAFSAPTELVPFGEVGQFLSRGHSQNDDREYLAFNSVLESTAPVKPSHLFFVLQS